MNIIVALVLTAVVASCQLATSDPAPVEEVDQVTADQQAPTLSTDRQTYSHNQEARLTLRNETQQGLGINLCFSTLEWRQGEEWTTVPDFPRDPCPAILHLLPPGEAGSEVFVLDDGLAAGVFRFRTRVEYTESGEDRWHTSNAFELIR